MNFLLYLLTANINKGKHPAFHPYPHENDLDEVNLVNCMYNTDFEEIKDWWLPGLYRDFLTKVEVSQEEKRRYEKLTEDEFKRLKKRLAENCPKKCHKCSIDKGDCWLLHGWKKEGAVYKHSYPLLGEYLPNSKTVVIYVKNIDDACEKPTYNGVLPTYIHELFHAYFHYVTAQKQAEYNYIREIEEAMTEFSTLVFLRYMGNEYPLEEWNNISEWALKSIGKKQKTVGNLSAYGFGRYLFDSIPENEAFDWINKYAERLGYIDEEDELVKQYKQMVCPCYPTEPKKCLELLRKILFETNNKPIKPRDAKANRSRIMAKSFETTILELYKKTEYQKLNAYYSQSTVFNVLGVERSENRHSAFLAWLFNPESTHGLKESPLRKFLSLVATKAIGQDQCNSQEVREHLITGNYSLQLDCIKTEQSIIGLANGNTDDFKDVVEKTERNGGFKQDANNRFDIWMLLNIKFADKNDVEQQWILPVVVENKIYSSEGNANDVKKAQTVRYHRAVNILKTDFTQSQPLLVFLTPSDVKKGPTDQAFIHITYQDLLDHILQPCSILSVSQTSSAEARALIDGYVRNLSCPSNRDGEKIKDYSILAIAETESLELETVFSSEAFQTSLCAIYPKEAQVLLDGEFHAVDGELTMMDQFWNANENLFKIVLYNHFKGDEKKTEIVRKIVKVSNRDNTRYLVGLKAGEWLNDKGRPASKSEASFLIFKAYCEQWRQQHPKENLTIEHLRGTFKTDLNSYYYNRWLSFLFYDFDNKVTVDVKDSKYFGDEITDKNTWDFYWDLAHKLPCLQGNVRSVKMWRKNDFEKLKEKAQSFGIIVEPIE